MSRDIDHAHQVSMEDANPFLSLFDSQLAAEESAKLARQQQTQLSDCLTRIFLFTATGVEGLKARSRALPRFLVPLPQLSRDEALRSSAGLLGTHNYQQALAERLQLASLGELPPVLVVEGGGGGGLVSQQCACEPDGVTYLAQCFARACSEIRDSKHGVDIPKQLLIADCKQRIAEMASPLLLMQHRQVLPVLRHSERSPSTFVCFVLDILSNDSFPIPIEFITCVADCHSEDLPTLKLIFSPVLDQVYNYQGTPQGVYIRALELFSQHSALAKVLVASQYWQPSVAVGRAFESHTFLGRLLRHSPIPASPLQPSAAFAMEGSLFKTEVEATTAAQRNELDTVTLRVYKIFHSLLRLSAESKQAVISWLVACCRSNAERGKMAARLGSGFNVLSSMQSSSDGFFLNLCWVLLRLSSPFVRGGAKGMSRLVTIDPAYCTVATPTGSHGNAAENVIDFSQETKLVPPPENQDGSGSQTQTTTAATTQTTTAFNFTTHCFFLTHRCLELGMSQVIHRMDDLMQVYSRLVSSAQASQQMPPQLRLLQSQLLGIKAHVMHPDLLELCMSFYTTTAQWLVHLVASGSHDSQASSRLQLVPESLVENMGTFATFLRHVEPESFTASPHHLSLLLSFVTVFTRSAQLVHNPHIRAKIVQLLTVMATQEKSGDSILPATVFSESQRALFESHTFASQHLIESLLTIFIDIEHTGDSMEFEDKFMYRLPMYDILEFLWALPTYKTSIEKLAKQAVLSSQQLETPVFLRFVNMMVNDATVQLDEGLENLAKIKSLEDVMESNEWEALSSEQRSSSEKELAEAKMMARNRNLLAHKTVQALVFLTQSTTQPFVIPTMVDRIAAMLNYVLNKLVGRKRAELKVRNFQKYHFNPGALVTSLVWVYLHLGREPLFCQALPRDGRSFSLELFFEAGKVLRALSQPDQMLVDLQELTERLRECQLLQQQEEEALEDAPTEYLDPITQELMRDPVLLPTSGHMMDRASIIRHLLSDQTDPFNRAPLTADMLEPSEELRLEIERWIAAQTRPGNSS